MAGLLWLVWADLGLPLDALPSLGVEKIRTWVVDRSHGHVLRAAGHTADTKPTPAATAAFRLVYPAPERTQRPPQRLWRPQKRAASAQQGGLRQTVV
jgi:hypothetical protein